MTKRSLGIRGWVGGIAAACIAVGLTCVARADVPQSATGSLKSAEAASNWATWRGPKRDNISPDTGLLKEWPKGGPPLLWKAKGLGAGYATVAISNGTLYTIGSQGESDETFLIALDSNGKKLWSSLVGHGRTGDAPHAGPRSTPTVDGDHVYAIDEVGNLGCFNASDGKQIWHINMLKDLHAKVMSGWGFAESVLIDGPNLICTPGGSGGTLAALDKSTGKVVWRSKEFTDACAYSSLVPAQIGGIRQYVVLTDKHVAGIGTDGKLVWEAKRDGVTAVCPTPIVDGNLVYTTSGYSVGCSCFEVTGTGSQLKAKQLYKNNEMQVHHGGVVQLDGYVYGVTDYRRGEIMCMDIKTGKVAWAEKFGSKGSTAYADGMLYVRSEGGPNKPCIIALVEATPSGYHEHGRFEQPDRSKQFSWAHPVIFGGKMYLRDDDVLLCYDVKAK